MITPSSLPSTAPSPSSAPNGAPSNAASNAAGRAGGVQGMKAIILVGGYGTRLRPLTFSKPKPLVPFCNIPIVEHQVKALVAVGVRHIIFAVAYQPSMMEAEVSLMAKTYGITIECSIEKEPMGTAGPIKLAENRLLEGDDSGNFFVLNSDVICDFPLRQMLQWHRRHGKEGTILTTKVQDARNYGVICTDATGCVESFVEKPQQFVADDINAGIYIFKSSILSRIPLRPTSIEREIFPIMTRDRQLYTYKLIGYWADVGRPRDLLVASALYLGALRQRESEELELQRETCEIVGNVLIAPTASVGKDCCLGPDVTVGPGTRIHKGVRLSNCSIFEDAEIESFSCIDNSIIGWKCRIGKWARVMSCVFGADVEVAQGVLISRTVVCPNKTITSDVLCQETEPMVIL